MAFRTVAGRVLRDVGRTVARADLAIAYCAVVVAVSLGVHLQPAARREEILDHLSGNVANLRTEPLLASLGSAFIVEGLSELLLVAQLLVVLAYLQRFVGRTGSVVVGLAGHVGAGLVVAVGISAGIVDGFVDPSTANATDVGVSYVMAAAMGFLVIAVPRRWRWWYLAATAVYWLLPGAVLRTFTDVGHATALSIGLLLAFVASRVVTADRRARADGGPGI